MLRLLTNRGLVAIVLAAATCIAVPAQAQAQRLRLDLGGGGSDAAADITGGGELDVDPAIELSPGNGVVVAISQQLALEAVRKDRALPLEDILLRATLLTDGAVIDARLISVESVLLYEVKVLAKTGEVSRLYFYARSGRLVAPG